MVKKKRKEKKSKALAVVEDGNGRGGWTSGDLSFSPMADDILREEARGHALWLLERETLYISGAVSLLRLKFSIFFLTNYVVPCDNIAA